MKKPKTAAKLEWKAGLSRLDITPKEPIWLAGWGGRDKPMQGVSQKIWTKVLALEDKDGARGVWVTADLLGYSKGMSDAVVARAKKKYGLEREQIILNSSHNHSGPVTGDLLHLYFELTKPQYAVIDRYTSFLLDQIVDAIGQALKDLKPARLQFAQGLAGFAVNRRRARAGGRCLPTVVDQDVPVLTVHNAKGDIRAVVFGYACHTTAINDTTLNGDYAGYAQQYIEDKLPGTLALFVAGCGGDANPLPRHQPGLGEAYGFILGNSVCQVIAQTTGPSVPGGTGGSSNITSVTGPLRMAFGEAIIPYETLPTKKELEAGMVGHTGTYRRHLQHQVNLMKDRDRRPTECRYPIHVWRFGDGLKHIALSSEPVADYAIRFKSTYGWEDAWVSGYNDEFFSYMPSLRVWREGGYEGHTGMLECDLPGPYVPAIEEIIAAKVDELMVEASGKPRVYPRYSKHE